MTIDTVLDRFAECNAEINGINRVDKQLPTKAILPADLPAMYAEALGMIRPAPGATSAGQYIIARRYRLTLLVAQTTVVSFDDLGEGSALHAAITALIDPVDDYYMRNPRLSTDAHGGMNELQLSEDITIQDSGPIIRSGPGGANYGQIQFIVTVAERRIPTRKALS